MLKKVESILHVLRTPKAYSIVVLRRDEKRVVGSYKCRKVNFHDFRNLDLLSVLLQL